MRLRSLSGNLGAALRGLQHSGGAIEAIENGVAVSRHTAVVGKPDRASPDINSRIVEVNFNPYWTVPVSIVRARPHSEDAGGAGLPHQQPHPHFRSRAATNCSRRRSTGIRKRRPTTCSSRIRATSIRSARSASISRARTACTCTTRRSKNLFGEDLRFHSSGCVRVQNVRELVNWLLIETPGWSRQEIDDVIKCGERKDARLPRPVPLYWVYVTAWATPDGVVQFRDDIYNRDGAGPAVSAAQPGEAGVLQRASHRGRDLGAEQLDRPHDLRVRHGADAHLHQIARVAERSRAGTGSSRSPARGCRP